MDNYLEKIQDKNNLIDKIIKMQKNLILISELMDMNAGKNLSNYLKYQEKAKLNANLILSMKIICGSVQCHC